MLEDNDIYLERNIKQLNIRTNLDRNNEPTSSFQEIRSIQC